MIARSFLGSIASQTAPLWHGIVQFGAIFVATAVVMAGLYLGGRWLSRKTGL